MYNPIDNQSSVILPEKKKSKISLNSLPGDEIEKVIIETHRRQELQAMFNNNEEDIKAYLANEKHKETLWRKYNLALLKKLSSQVVDYNANQK